MVRFECSDARCFWKSHFQTEPPTLVEAATRARTMIGLGQTSCRGDWDERPGGVLDRLFNPPQVPPLASWPSSGWGLGLAPYS